MISIPTNLGRNKKSSFLSIGYPLFLVLFVIAVFVVDYLNLSEQLLSWSAIRQNWQIGGVCAILAPSSLCLAYYALREAHLKPIRTGCKR